EPGEVTNCSAVHVIEIATGDDLLVRLQEEAAHVVVCARIEAAIERARVHESCDTIPRDRVESGEAAADDDLSIPLHGDRIDVLEGVLRIQRVSACPDRCREGSIESS